jgi:hypothetical protein
VDESAASVTNWADLSFDHRKHSNLRIGGDCAPFGVLSTGIAYSTLTDLAAQHNQTPNPLVNPNDPPRCSRQESNLDLPARRTKGQYGRIARNH